MTVFTIALGLDAMSGSSPREYGLALTGKRPAGGASPPSGGLWELENGSGTWGLENGSGSWELEA